jgi:2-oxoglutarate dehydrogenase E1 component
MGFETATVRELVECLRRNYCGKIGLEYMHINDLEERRFLRSGWRARRGDQLHAEGKLAILTKVIEGEEWEKFLARKYVGHQAVRPRTAANRWCPALESVIKYGGQHGVREIVLGMAHRGRLNVLSNVMGKPYRVIFSNFAGGSANPEDVGGSGDVKYHLGTSSDREFDGVKGPPLAGAEPKPSRGGRPGRARQGARGADVARRSGGRRGAARSCCTAMPPLPARGIVAECFGFSGLPGYGTGGTLHFVINNQVGFTTSPQFGRSSPYPSDIAKSVQAPIFHVNGDDPEAVTFACKVAIEYRQCFNRDIVIDMWCYRRFGHNEGDEPSFTQPLMYAAIRQHPPVSALYARRLIDEGVIDQPGFDSMVSEFTALLEGEFEAAKAYLPNKADWFEGAGRVSAGRALPKPSAATCRPRSMRIGSPNSARR